MKKVFLIIPTLRQGGAERVMSELANDWVYKNCEVNLILLNSDRDIFYKIDERVNIIPLEFVYTNRMDYVLNQVKIFFKLRKLIIEKKPDFLLSFMTKYNILSIFASGFTKTRTYVSDRSSANTKLPFLQNILRMISYSFADGIIAQTHTASRIIKKQVFNKNITVIENPIKKIHQHPEIVREKIILNVGRLVWEKGQTYLLEAFVQTTCNDDWKLVLLGEGPERQKLEMLIETLNLTGKVVLNGQTKDVDYWLNKASVFAFSSVSEGFPNALIEAMGAGLACVSFDCDSGPADIINNEENGFLVPLKDTRCFAEKLTLLMNDEGLRMKMGSEAKKINERLSLENISNMFFTFCNH
ncbi:glycosyltransferase family 4 protein [Flavobacterium sp. WV_118_3]|uniref:glycosyltransferase family 4 protein n=1 Tax=Flavobacterium sp. WV_118_3 TaxID=3151764 RepID=UPI00321BAD04